jgi:hypothetical protein
MPIPKHIVNMLLDRILENVTLIMQTNVSPTDPLYADVVKKGLLQTDKTSKNIQIGIQGGDHEDPNMKDGVSSLARMPDLGFDHPIYEVGGGKIWSRRGTARIECFFIRERLTENAAHEQAYAALGRLVNAIETISMEGLDDDYGEQALQIFCYATKFFESGGPPKSFIFRGAAYWEVRTGRP